VPLEAVDPVYFDTTYYLAPDKGGAKPYTLFAMALRERRRCAVGRWATRGKDHVVILRPVENGLALHQLHFAPEVVAFQDLGVEDAKVREPELKLAEQLIDQQTSERFDPTVYKDQVRERIQAAIQRKVEGEQISISEPRPPTEGKVVDLMEALRASLNRNTRERGESPDVAERRPPRRAGRKAPAHRRTGTDGRVEHRRTTSR
jgi:DNA end-binding protein Ku